MKSWRNRSITALLVLGSLGAIPGPLQADGLRFFQKVESIVPLQFEFITFEGDELTATVSVGGNAFKVPVNLELSQLQPSDGTCAIITLTIDPMHIDLLGVVIDTSGICLDVTAVEGEAVGDMFCEIAEVFDSGRVLGDALRTLSEAELVNLVGSPGTELEFAL